MRFKDKHILITGAGGEMATTMATQILREGGTVFALDKNDRAMMDFKSTLNSSEQNSFISYISDITDANGISDTIGAIIKQYQKIDILINHAGFTECETFAEINLTTWKREVDINFQGTYNVTSQVLPHMEKNRSGNIVTIGSVNIDRYYGNPAYSAAKAALLSMTTSIAGEYGQYNIRSNMVSPGSVRTKGWDFRIKRNPQIFEKMLRWYPLKKLATPQAISNAVLFLASDEADCITGVNLRVDAGLNAACIPLIDDITSKG